MTLDEVTFTGEGGNSDLDPIFLEPRSPKPETTEKESAD